MPLFRKEIYNVRCDGCRKRGGERGSQAGAIAWVLEHGWRIDLVSDGPRSRLFWCPECAAARAPASHSPSPPPPHP